MPILLPSQPKILLVRLSSMGDLVHVLPAVSDLQAARPDAIVHWAAEPAFAEIAALHPFIRKVIPCPLRTWRKKIQQRSTWQAFQQLRQQLRQEHYDMVIDAHGLLKSAVIAQFTQCKNRHGLNKASAREGISNLFYHHTHGIALHDHMIERHRSLFAQSLDYRPSVGVDYGIQAPNIALPDSLQQAIHSPYIVALHSTSRDNKLWNEANWIALGQHYATQGIQLILPWGSASEQQRSQRLATHIPNALVPARLNLTQAAQLMYQSIAIVGVDTGLVHLAAALNKPTVAIFTVTDQTLAGVEIGRNNPYQRAVCDLGGGGTIPTLNEVIDALESVQQYVTPAV